MSSRKRPGPPQAPISSDNKRPRSSDGEDSASSTAGTAVQQPPASSLPQPSSVADLIAQKKREIAAKLQAASISSTQPSGPAATASTIIDGDKLAKQIEQIKARAAATVPKVSDALAYAPKDRKGLKAQVHPSLMVDEATGRLGVKSDNLTESPIIGSTSSTSAAITTTLAVQPVTTVRRPQFATTKANERASSELLMDKKKRSADQKSKATAAAVSNPYLAHAAGVLSARALRTTDPGYRHIPRTFRFAEQGQYTEQAERIRKEMELERLREQIAQKVKRAGLDSELDLVGDQAVKHEPVPAVEWWDLQFLPGRSYDDFTSPDKMASIQRLLMLDPEDNPEAAVITDLIQHPVPIEPLRDPNQTAETRPLMLTKREQKKMRRLRRMEAHKERQEKIRLGLLPPAQPKMNLSNLMRVVGTEAVADPTTMEKVVRAQMKQRAEEHLRRNTEQQLTSEQLTEKKQRKMTEDITNKTHVAVFRIKDLSNPAHRFKITTNARQNNLTGLCLVYSDVNIVIVEGGPKALARYKALMLRRIRWRNGSGGADEEDGGEGDEQAASATDNQCHLVWEGLLRQPQYRGFHQIACQTEQKLKESLGDHGQHYYDTVKNFIPPSGS